MSDGACAFGVGGGWGGPPRCADVVTVTAKTIVAAKNPESTLYMGAPSYRELQDTPNGLSGCCLSVKAMPARRYFTVDRTPAQPFVSAAIAATGAPDPGRAPCATAGPRSSAECRSAQARV